MKKLFYRIFAGILITTICITVTGCSKTNEVKKVTPPPVTPPPVTDTPSITSVIPLKALPTSQISIYGTNFNKILADNKVTVNGIAATVDSASSTEIVFTLPANAKSGKIELTSGGIKANYSSDFTVVHPDVLIDFADGEFEHVAIDANGNAYGDDGGANDLLLYTVNKATPTGVVSRFATLTDVSAQLYGVAVDKAGNVYEVNKAGYNCIYKITPSGGISVLAGGTTNGYADGQGGAAKFSALCGLAIDAKGNLYTNDNHYIRKITPGGLVSTIAGSGADGHADGPALSATFGHTEGIAIDTKGNVFLSDNKYLNIRKISPTGLVTTLAGNGNVGLADGTGNVAEFSYPQGMAVDAAGNVFVSDSNGGAAEYMRMITQDGVVTTFLESSPDGLSNRVIGQVPYASVNLSYTDGLAFDNSGNLYMCNTLYSCILKLDFK